MKPIYLLIFSLFIIVNSYSVKAELVDKVIATLDGEPVNLSELQVYFEETYANFKEDKKITLADTLKEFLSLKMIEKEAKELGVSIAVDDVDLYVEEIKKNQGSDNFDQALKEKNIDIDSYKKQVAIELLRTRVISQALKQKNNIVDEDIVRYLKEHNERLPEEGSINLIEFKVEASEDNEAESYLNKFKSNIKAGNYEILSSMQFAKDLGYVKIADLKSEYAEVLKGLKAGETSDVFVSGDYMMFFWIKDEFVNSSNLSDRFKERIKTELIQKNFMQNAESYLSKDLPKKYKVEILSTPN